MDKQKQQEAYKNYVKQKTPVHNLPLNMLKAFITGGIICTIGQGILNYCRHLGIEKDISAGWTSMILILLSVLLTGFNIYPQLYIFDHMKVSLFVILLILSNLLYYFLNILKLYLQHKNYHFLIYTKLLYFHLLFLYHLNLCFYP